KHWWWVLPLVVAATLAGINYAEGLRGIPWQGEVLVQVEGPYALSPSSYDQQAASLDGITPQFDFTSVANSGHVATQVIQPPRLPTREPHSLFLPPMIHPEWPSILVQSADPMNDAQSGGLLSSLLGGSSSSSSKPKTHMVTVTAYTYDQF